MVVVVAIWNLSMPLKETFGLLEPVSENECLFMNMIIKTLTKILQRMRPEVNSSHSVSAPLQAKCCMSSHCISTKMLHAKNDLEVSRAYGFGHRLSLPKVLKLVRL